MNIPSVLVRFSLFKSHLTEAKPPLFSSERYPSKEQGEEDLLIQRLDDLPPMTVSLTIFQFKLEGLAPLSNSCISAKELEDRTTMINAKKSFIFKTHTFFIIGKNKRQVML
tara:strand:+ start:158 stop:490 length:333 start_codon:yes stop_codon:yes gene_type:complete